MDRFEVLFRKWNVNVTQSPLDGARSEMQRWHGLARITVHQGLHPYERDETIATQLGHLELGHPYWSYADVGGRWWRSWFDNRARLWAASYLIPDQALERAIRGKWYAWELAEECGVTTEFVGLRLRDPNPFFA